MINLNKIAMTCLVLSYVFFTSCEKSEDTKILNTEVISKDITSNLTLKNNVNGVDYIIQGCIELKASAILTIEAGTTIAFTQNSCLEVHEFAAIKAIGTETNPITFTGEQQTKGFWDGISFYNTNNQENVLSHCIIEYAGNAKISTASNARKAALIIGKEYKDPVRISIDHVTIRHNLNTGLSIYNNAIMNKFEYCQMLDNQNSILVYDQSIQYMDPFIIAKDNQINNVQWIYNTSSSVVNSVFSIKAIPLSYQLISSFYKMEAGGKLTIEAGVNLIMSPSSVIYATNGGIIDIKGTSVQKVKFSGEFNNVNYWRGIYADNGGRLNIDHAVISDGGEASTNFGGMVAQSSDGALYISNSTLSNFLKYGIAYYASKPHNADIETSNSCSGNTGISCFWKR